jgi:hypothetical protein
VKQYIGFSKMKNKLPYNPAIPLLDIHGNKVKTVFQIYYTFMFIATLFIIAKKGINLGVHE